tara:strand:- start:1004 stop:1711 length:708 start_codon:yes stop_codon:yes gene_type:complete
MSTYNPNYNLTALLTDFKTCASSAGFCTVKFGKASAINFDHNICYDLLNIGYPRTTIAEGIREVYTFNLVLARPVKSGSTQGVQLFDDDVAAIMSELEVKLWNMLGCLALGISGGGGCRAHIPKHKIQIIRDKGTFNDNLVTLQVQFDAIANIAVTVEPCGGGGGTEPDDCNDPCAQFFGGCGCTDPTAINYDSTAGVDDGTCCYNDADPGSGDPCDDGSTTFPPTFPSSQTQNP